MTRAFGRGSILKGRDLLKQNGRWVVGDGSNIDIRNGVWLASGVLAKVNESCPLVKMGDCINASSKCWDLQKLKLHLHHNSAMEAVKTPISIMGGKDSFWWPHSTNGCYSVKFGYFVSHQILPPNPLKATSSSTIPNSLWSLLWGSLVPQKVKHFVWKLCHNALPLKKNLHQRKLNVCPLCPICSTHEETIYRACFLAVSMGHSSVVWSPTTLCA